MSRPSTVTAPGSGSIPARNSSSFPAKTMTPLRRGHPAVLDEADLPQGRASPGEGPGAGHELAAAGDDEIS